MPKAAHERLTDSGPLFCALPGREAVPPAILAFDDFNHVLRAFPAAVFQPELYDLRDPRPEKLHMIFDKTILKMLTGKGCIIPDDFIVVIIAELKVGLIDDLVLFDMAK